MRRTGIGESRGRTIRDRMKKMGDPLSEIPQLNAGENPASKIFVWLFRAFGEIPDD